ncbi:MAG TPA: flagellar biosynthesis protein FlhB [Nitrolancea sp.]|nr:flagellar biosynthesis protein FlhB [Candidatus Dormibacteraeota bacterium]HVB65588.1 flagellar biosynthesis protein FlhB [Nitrolancea sp.]
MPKPEQTEKATPKRREESRKRGQVPKSQELGGAAIFLVSVFVIHGFFMQTMAGLESTATAVLSRVANHQDFTVKSVWLLFIQATGGLGFVLVLLFGVALVVGILANVLQFGFLFTMKPLAPSFGKLNPINGFKRLFSKQVVVSLAKQLIKLSAVGILIYSAVSSNLSFFDKVGQSTPATIVMLTANLIYGIAWKFGMLLVIVGLLDFAYEKWQLEQNLKMTKQEVRDEHRQAEGNPEVKGQLKRRQRESSRRRMMSAVPRATVVVTNPTHYAVALEWDEVEMDAPVVVAKGADLVAKRIRDLAREHRIPIMENPPLARTLYERVELDQSIPPNLYAAVAQVIAFVYKLKRKTIA